MSKNSSIFNCVNLFNLSEECLKYCESLIKQVRRPKKRENALIIIRRLDEVSNNLCSVIDYAESVNRLAPNSEFSKEATKACSNLLAYMSELNADKAIYSSLVDCINRVEKGKKKASSRPDEEIIIGNALKEEYESGGILLSDVKRAEYAMLQQKMHQQAYQFEQSSPSNAIDSLYNLLTTRQSVAKLMGFTNYSDLVLRDHMMKSSNNLSPYLETCHEKYSLVKQRRNRIEEDFHYSDLTFKEVLSILNEICRKHYRCHFEINLERIWDSFWWKLSFNSSHLGKKNPFMGEVYVGLSHRFSPCHYPIRTWRDQKTLNIAHGGDLEYQTPICMITCGVEDMNNLTFNEIQSLFHEFGHALHMTCGRTLLHHAAGTRCKFDFAEVPSTYLEMFVTQSLLYKYLPKNKKVEKSILYRYEDWIELMKYNLDENKIRLIALSKLDLFLHTYSYDGNKNLFVERLSLWIRENSRIPIISLNSIHSFKHLASYASSYYSYLFSAEVAQSIWSRYMDKNSIFRNNYAFHDFALRYGGTKSTEKLFESLKVNPIPPQNVDNY